MKQTAVMDSITVEIAYGTAEQQWLQTLNVPTGTTAREAVLHSSIATALPGVDLHNAVLGIFGKVIQSDTVLRARDRIEIYRPLLIDPKEARRLRVQSKTE